MEFQDSHHQLAALGFNYANRNSGPEGIVPFEAFIPDSGLVFTIGQSGHDKSPKGVSWPTHRQKVKNHQDQKNKYFKNSVTSS